LVLRSTNDVQRNILAHQAVSSEPGSLGMPEHRAKHFFQDHGTRRAFPTTISS
jgi:hypothetical protein